MPILQHKRTCLYLCTATAPSEVVICMLSLQRAARPSSEHAVSCKRLDVSGGPSTGDKLALGYRQNLDPLFSDQQRELVLRGQAAVSGHARPLVGPEAPLGAACRQHGLDGEGLPRPHDVRLVVGVVQHCGRGVEDGAHTVAAEVGHQPQPAVAGTLPDVEHCG